MWKTDRKSYHIINLPLTTLAPWPLEAMTITPHRTLRIFCSALFFDDFILDREKELWNKNGIVKIKKILRSHQSSPVYCQFVDCDSALSLRSLLLSWFPPKCPVFTFQWARCSNGIRTGTLTRSRTGKCSKNGGLPRADSPPETVKQRKWLPQARLLIPLPFLLSLLSPSATDRPHTAVTSRPTDFLISLVTRASHPPQSICAKSIDSMLEIRWNIIAWTL